MGLFDKKYCDICGEKIGLLGNRKLEDGNLCKDCAGKLSPFFSDRRNSTVEEIKAQLAYAVIESTTWKEENEKFYYDTKTEGEFLGEKVDPFAEITVTEDGCLLYEYEMVLLERI